LNKNAQNLSGNNEIKGICANSGYAKAEQKFCIIPAKIPRSDPATFLIAPATTVDYLPAMKKAAAFVTELAD